MLSGWKTLTDDVWSCCFVPCLMCIGIVLLLCSMSYVYMYGPVASFHVLSYTKRSAFDGRLLLKADSFFLSTVWTKLFTLNLGTYYVGSVWKECSCWWCVQWLWRRTHNDVTIQCWTTREPLPFEKADFSSEICHNHFQTGCQGHRLFRFAPISS